MPISPFHALYKARILSNYSYGREKLLPVFASSNMKVLPYQVAASMFALRSPNLKGCILGDEGSLGKTYEAMLIVTQKWYEGKEHILIVLPTHLLFQWVGKINDCFSVPYTVIDSEEAFKGHLKEDNDNPFARQGVIITTYEYAVKNAEHLSEINWDIAVFDEADRLNNCHEGENKTAITLKQITADSYKILLTPTPINKKIMDIYGLVYFIDETALPDPDYFYNRYNKKPENYPELAERVSRFCYRTLRSQVTGYVNIPNRTPITATYDYTLKEQQLYNLITKYIMKPKKTAYPQMKIYDLALMLYGRMSSSVWALEKMLLGANKRLQAEMKIDNTNNDLKEECLQIQQMLDLTQSIYKIAKDKELLAGIETAFARLKKIGGKQKALIFTDKTESQKHLYQLLNKGKYAGKVMNFNGGKSRDFSVWKRFEKDIKIVIATDVASKGLDIPFCSLVVNYDLPYDALKIDQRINRCQRQDQSCEVIVLNFINKNSYYDLRILQLINKRLLQFKGVFGMSDDLIGALDVDIKSELAEILSEAKTTQELQSDFADTLAENEDKNAELVASATNALFSSFNHEIAEKVTITPQYVKDKTKEINDMLWEVTEYFFDGTQIETDSETRTITTYALFGSAQKVFTGGRIGRNEYSMSPDYQPRSGRYTATCSLARNVLSEIFWRGIPDNGSVTVDENCEKCKIGFYQITVKSKASFWNNYSYYVFIGKTASGKMLSHEECQKIMEIPVTFFTKDGEQYGRRDGISKTKRHEEFDDLIDTSKYIQKTKDELDNVIKDETIRLKIESADKKVALERSLNSLRSEIQAVQKEYENEQNRLLKLQIEKRINSLQKQLKQKEQSLFMDGLRLDASCDETIKKLADKMNYTAEVKREFIIQVTGNN